MARTTIKVTDREENTNNVDVKVDIQPPIRENEPLTPAQQIGLSLAPIFDGKSIGPLVALILRRLVASGYLSHFQKTEFGARCGRRPRMTRWTLRTSYVPDLLSDMLQRFDAHVYIHRHIGVEDRQHMHDHPWDYFAVVLSGVLIETRLPLPGEDVSDQREDDTIVRELIPGDQILRGAAHPHKLEVHPDCGEAWTLVVRGPTVRKWGFWRTPTEWEDSVTYLNKEFGFGAWQADPDYQEWLDLNKDGSLEV